VQFENTVKLQTKYSLYIYTVNRKKGVTLFSTITPAFLGRFFYILFAPVETGRNTLQTR